MGWARAYDTNSGRGLTLVSDVPHEAAADVGSIDLLRLLQPGAVSSRAVPQLVRLRDGAATRCRRELLTRLLLVHWRTLVMPIVPEQRPAQARTARGASLKFRLRNQQTWLPRTAACVLSHAVPLTYIDRVGCHPSHTTKRVRDTSHLVKTLKHTHTPQAGAVLNFAPNECIFHGSQNAQILGTTCWKRRVAHALSSASSSRCSASKLSNASASTICAACVVVS